MDHDSGGGHKANDDGARMAEGCGAVQSQGPVLLQRVVDVLVVLTVDP